MNAILEERVDILERRIKELEKVRGIQFATMIILTVNLTIQIALLVLKLLP